jgi:RimK family alpha-L-glutamate ligase
VNALRPKVAILTERENFAVAELRRALEQRGIVPAVLPASRLGAQVGSPGSGVACAGVTLDDFDLVLVRQVPGGSLEQVIFRMDALHRLSRRGVRVMNPPLAIERMVDKYATSTLLHEAGIPTPATVVVQTYPEAIAALEQFGDLVAKPIFGAEGRGIVRIADPDTGYRVFRAWEQIGAVYYLQQYIDHGHRDLRAFVIGDWVVAAMERVGTTWKTNVAMGAAPRAVRLPAAWAELAVRAVHAVGADYAGVDLLPAADGAVYVHEVNSMPAWTGLQQTTALQIGEAVVDYGLSLVSAPGVAP